MDETRRTTQAYDQIASFFFFAYYHPAEAELALERAGFQVIHCGLELDSRRPDLTWISVIGWTKLITPHVGANVTIFNGAGQLLLTRR